MVKGRQVLEMPCAGFELMSDKHWPFTRQSDYDAFMSNMKSDRKDWKDLAIQAWIEARHKQPKEGEKDA